MTTKGLCHLSIPFLSVLTLGLVFSSLVSAAPVVIRGRGVHFCTGPLKSRIPGLGHRALNETSRVILPDEHTEFELNRKRRRIVVRNTNVYQEETKICDFVMLGLGKTETGKDTRFGLHVQVYKEGRKIRSEIDVHPTTKERFAPRILIKYPLVYEQDGKERVLISTNEMLEAIRQPKGAVRIKAALVGANDHMERMPPTGFAQGRRVADVTVQFQLPLFSRDLMRGILTSDSKENRTLVDQQGVGYALAKGDWTLTLTRLSKLVPEKDLLEDFETVGFFRSPGLRNVLEKGFPVDSDFVFKLRAGRGTAFFGGQSFEVPDATDAASHFLEFFGIGAIMLQQIMREQLRLE